MTITPGLYEQIITEGLQKELTALGPELRAKLARIEPAESHFILSQYVGQFLVVSSILCKIQNGRFLKEWYVVTHFPYRV
jgi:hypothetical protein